MKKNYILDTNVLIHDPRSIFKFQDNTVYIPIFVLEELDKIKGESSLRGKSSREACRILDDLRCQGSLSDGVSINDGEGILCIYVPKERNGVEVALDKNMDSLILQAALEIQNKTEPRSILVTMDVNLRVRADVLGLQTATYENTSVDVATLDAGITEIWVGEGQVDKMFKEGGIKIPEKFKDLPYNAPIFVKDEINGNVTLGRYYKKYGMIRALNLPREGTMNIRPKSKEQSFAMDLLLDDEVKLVMLSGGSGTGKTLLTLACGLHKVLNEGSYTRIIITKPVIAVGKDVGFLPGELNSKLLPWMQPFFDNIEFLMMNKGKSKKEKDKFKKRDEFDRVEGDHTYDSLLEEGLVKMEALTFMRGRSIPSQFIILDETQNISNHELKTMVTRCGEGTKIVLLGDPDQIDNPYLNQANCGLSIAMDKLMDHPLVGHVKLTKGERSELATLASDCL